MLPTAKNPREEMKQMEYYKMLIKKTFDIIDHKALLHGLRDHGVAEPYIRLLGKLYTDQHASVNDSSTFPITRDVKQGDVLSAILFNCVLHIAFEKWKQILLHEATILKLVN